MDQKWSDYKAKGEYGLTWREKYNFPRTQTALYEDDPAKTNIGLGYQTSQNSVSRSSDAVASFGNSSMNLFIKSKINDRRDGPDYSAIDLDQTRKRQSSYKSSTFLQQLERKYLPNRKSQHKDALRFLETLISVLRIHIHKQQRQVFILLQGDKKEFNRAAQFMEYEKQMRKRLHMTKSESAKLTEMQLSDVKPVGDYFESQNHSYVHNATKIDALAEPNLQVQISQVERPSFKDYEDRDLQIQSVTKSQFATNRNFSEVCEPKNQAFKFKPKVQKKIMDRKKSEGFNGIIHSFDYNTLQKKEQEEKLIQYKIPKWLVFGLDEQPLSESNPFMEKIEINKEIYHLNPDTFKDSNNDFYQPIMPENKDGQTFSSFDFKLIKGTSPSTETCSPKQNEAIVGQTENTLSANLNPASKHKKYSFVNPYMKNIDSDSNDIATINDLISDEGVQNFVPQEVNKNEERGYEASNSFRISDQNSIESEKEKRETYTQQNLPKLNEQYFSQHKIQNQQQKADRSIQYKISPQERSYIRPKSNTVGVRNPSAVSISPKKNNQSQKVEDPWKKKLQSKIKQNIYQDYDIIKESSGLIQKYPQNFGEYLEKNQQAEGSQFKILPQQNSINFSINRSQNFERPQSKIIQQQQQPPASQKNINIQFRNYPPAHNVQQFNKPTRAVSSGHFTYHHLNTPQISSSLPPQNNPPREPRIQLNNQYFNNPQPFPERRTQIHQAYNDYGSNRPSYVSPPNKNYPSVYFTEKNNNFSEIRNNNSNLRYQPAQPARQIQQMQQSSRLPIQYGINSPKNQKPFMNNPPTTQIYFHNNRSPPIQKRQYRSPPPIAPGPAPSNPPSQLKLVGQESTLVNGQEGSKTPSRGNKKIHIFSAMGRKE